MRSKKPRGIAINPEQSGKLRELQLKNYLSMILLPPEVMAEELQADVIYQANEEKGTQCPHLDGKIDVKPD